MKFSRRDFFRKTTYVTAGFWGLRHYVSAQDRPAEPLPPAYVNETEKYGALIPDPHGLLDLPKGFNYTVLSRTGDFMDDGFRTPGAPDGMAAFPGPPGKTILVRNHELNADSTFDGPYGLQNELFSKIDARLLYDAGKKIRPHLGGTSTLVYDWKSRRVERQFLSLVGTTRNCAGGLTPWGTWITCEETVEKIADPAVENSGYNEKDHGYNFEVPVTTEPKIAEPVPLKAMGRFNHEAIAVDPLSGIVYETEDRPDGLFYRFIPEEPGRLAKGGRLQFLAVRDKKPYDTRNWPETRNPKLAPRVPLAVEWIDIDNVEAPEDDLRLRGHTNGAARFARGEGIWYGDGEIYFACTSGGVSKVGQVFRYVPSPFEGTEREKTHPGLLELYLEPNNLGLLEYCDNVTIAPWGDLVLCEDGSAENYLRGVTPDGKMYTLAYNSYPGESEFCGVCFAPDHPTLFVNIQRPGITLAVTGPWSQAIRRF